MYMEMYYVGHLTENEYEIEMGLFQYSSFFMHFVLRSPK